MRLYLQAFPFALAIVAAWAAVLAGIDVMAQPSSPNKPGEMTAIIFVVVLCLSLAKVLWSAIGKDLLIKRVVRDVVGIMPGQIDEWKWRSLAILKVEDRLQQLAMRIKDLDREEQELLRRVSAPTEKVLEVHKNIKEALREFREIHDVFGGFDLKLKDSWNDYLS